MPATTNTMSISTTAAAKLALLGVIASSTMSAVQARNSLAATPPMGWMSWELFRCKIDCDVEPDFCISEKLYKAQTDALAAGGYIAAGTSAKTNNCKIDTPHAHNTKQ